MKDMRKNPVPQEHCGRKLTFNMAASGASGVVGCVVTVVSYPVYLHYLGYNELGLWLVLSTFVTLCQLGSLGIAPAVSKLVAEEFGEGNIHGAQRYADLAVFSVAVLGTATVGLLLLFRALILHSLHLSTETEHAVVRLLPLILIISFYVFLTDVFGAVLTGLGRMDLTSAIQAGGQAVALGCSSILLAMHQGVIALAFGMLASLVIIHIFTAVFAWRLGPVALRPALRLDWPRSRRLLRLASTVFATSLAAALFVPLNKLLLSRYVGLSAVPVYDLAFTGSMRLRALFEMALRPIMPALSSAVSSGRNLHAELERVNHKAQSLLILGGLAFGLVFLFADPLLRIWLRHSMNPAIPGALRLALLGAFVSLLGVPAFYALLGLNRAGSLFVSHVIQSATNAAVVLLAVVVGFRVSLSMLLAASGLAMGASTCFLVARYRASQRGLGSAAGRPGRDDPGITDVVIAASPGMMLGSEKA